jgi:hypothetical protein
MNRHGKALYKDLVFGGISEDDPIRTISTHAHMVQPQNNNRPRHRDHESVTADQLQKYLQRSHKHNTHNTSFQVRPEARNTRVATASSTSSSSSSTTTKPAQRAGESSKPDKDPRHVSKRILQKK